MTSDWYRPFKAQHNTMPFAHLAKLFNFSQFEQWPNAQGLNQLKQQSLIHSNACPDFICQSQLTESDDYYEQYIFKYQRIPTRPNSWHDFFNALIWLQFPKTKTLLNQQHMADIQNFGLHPRNARRNKLTHFDECGVVIAVEREASADVESLQANMPALLRAHQWQQVFVEQRALWGSKMHSFMFGHANLEMLLQPFIGLTGKWLSVEVPAGFGLQSQVEQLSILDQVLFDFITENDVFAHKNALYPLPLLGIPALTEANKDPRYYENTDYFRPVSKHQCN